MTAPDARKSRLRLIAQVFAITSIALAAAVPIVVLALRAVGVIGPHQYYPHPAAWPTIFSSAVLLTVGLNLVVWLRLTARSTFRRWMIGVAAPLLVVGSFVAVGILVLLGYLIYFRLPVL